jgi:TRAP-type C4-dicarboxylate transport system permease small subunit
MPVETQEKKPLRRRRVPWLLGALVVISFVVLVLLQTSNLWKDFAVETASDTLLLYALSSLNFFAFVIFGFIFLRSILKLLRERRDRSSWDRGSRRGYSSTLRRSACCRSSPWRAFHTCL